MCGNLCAMELKELRGAFVRYVTRCLTCGHCRDWSNSDKTKNTPLINIMICAGLLFAGCLPTKTIRMMGLLNIRFPKKHTFTHYQRNYLHGVSITLHYWNNVIFTWNIETRKIKFCYLTFKVVREVYNDQQKTLDESLRETPLRLNGDGRFSSPGHSGKFNNDWNRILLVYSPSHDFRSVIGKPEEWTSSLFIYGISWMSHNAPVCLI